MLLPSDGFPEFGVWSSLWRGFFSSPNNLFLYSSFLFTASMSFSFKLKVMSARFACGRLCLLGVTLALFLQRASACAALVLSQGTSLALLTKPANRRMALGSRDKQLGQSRALTCSRRSMSADDEDSGDRPELLDSLDFFSEMDDADDGEALLAYSIDSFLRGDYEYGFADDAPAPHPGLTPGSTIDAALRALRRMDDPEPSHGAAVLMRFCVPLSRGQRWGGGDTSRAASSSDAWKEVLRGAITPTMLARRIRASQFSCLLDWKSLDVTEGAFPSSFQNGGDLPSLAYVNAALYFANGIEPTLIQFSLRRTGGVWLIDSARLNQKELFVEDNDRQHT